MYKGLCELNILIQTQVKNVFVAAKQRRAASLGPLNHVCGLHSGLRKPYADSPLHHLIPRTFTIISEIYNY
jgi:hypothetical protein